MTNKDKPTGTTEEVRKFGITFFIILTLLSGYLWYKGSTWWPWAAGVGVLFLGTGTLVPVLLRPLFRAWMAFAYVLAWVNTRLILGIFFYLILSPIGLLMRLFGSDLLDMKLNREAETYWKKRDPAAFDNKRCERQF